MAATAAAVEAMKWRRERPAGVGQSSESWAGVDVTVCSLSRRSLSLRTQQDLDCAALVHGAIAFRNLGKGQDEVEDLAGVDLAVPHEVDELGQVATHRGGPTVQPDVREEHVLPVESDAVWHPHVTDAPSRPRGADGLP